MRNAGVQEAGGDEKCERGAVMYDMHRSCECKRNKKGNERCNATSKRGRSEMECLDNATPVSEGVEAEKRLSGNREWIETALGAKGS
jgi:hypothetical protein